MLEALRHTVFRRLFMAQVIALVGTGLTTVALALLAYDLAGAQAGAVLGTALAIKMGVYIVLGPVATAIVPPARRKAVLIAMDLVRAGVVLCLPFVDAIWQVYVLIAVLQSASACFTPLFQSLIPEILPDEATYTRALSLSRLAYDLEMLLSPALAAVLLTLMTFDTLFVGTSFGFIGSALFVLAARIPAGASHASNVSPYARALRGMRIYVHTPRLRGLLALNVVAAACGAMVFVNTVVVVRDVLGGQQNQVAWALAAFGGGSMLVALTLPRVLERFGDRTVMLGGGVVSVLALGCAWLLWRLQAGAPGWSTVLTVWLVLGMAYAAIVTPSGRLLRRSAQPDDLPQLFAAQFSLSHACWLLAYPLAGWVGARVGLDASLAALAVLGAVGVICAWIAWPSSDPSELPHTHPELPADHEHLQSQSSASGSGHVHDYRIDALHERWPHA